MIPLLISRFTDAQASIRAYIDAARDDFWQGTVARPSAERILRGLRTSIEMQPLSEAARIIARDEGVSLGMAVPKARPRIAEYDRFLNAAEQLAGPDAVCPSRSGPRQPQRASARARSSEAPRGIASPPFDQAIQLEVHPLGALVDRVDLRLLPGRDRL